MSRPPAQTRVLIIGGGPVGLAAGMEFATRDIDCVVVEPRTTISRSRPRAKTTNVRTMEHFRRWGLAARIRELAPVPVEWSQDVLWEGVTASPSCSFAAGWRLES